MLLRLEERNGGLVADVCKKSVKTMVKNALENIENQIHQVPLPSKNSQFKLVLTLFFLGLASIMFEDVSSHLGIFNGDIAM